MARKAMVALGCAALALLMAAAVSLPAEARRGGHGGHGFHGGGGHRGHGWHGGGGHRFGGGHFHHRHFHHRHFHHRHFHGGPVFYGYYGDGCYWLRRRAVYTGSPYWWRRYRACLAGYY